MKSSRVFLIIALACIASVSSLAVRVQEKQVNPTSSINEGIIALLESMRINFPCGFPDYGIRVLEPLFMEQITAPISSPTGLHDIHFNMQNVDVSELSGFIINHVDFVLLPLNFHFDFTFPQLVLNGTHQTIAQIAGLIPVPISGNGPFGMVINNVRAIGDARLAIRGGFLFMDDVVVDATLGTVQSHIQGFGGGLIENRINSIVESSIPSMAQTEAEMINDLLREMMLPGANAILNDMTLTDLINLIFDANTTENVKRC